MADFCQQCSIELFNYDSKDLANLMPPEKYKPENRIGAAALCEECGATVVDIDGKCISRYCLKQHGKNKLNVIDGGRL